MRLCLTLSSDIRWLQGPPHPTSRLVAFVAHIKSLSRKVKGEDGKQLCMPHFPLLACWAGGAGFTALPSCIRLYLFPGDLPLVPETFGWGGGAGLRHGRWGILGLCAPQVLPGHPQLSYTTVQMRLCEHRFPERVLITSPKTLHFWAPQSWEWQKRF